MMCELLHSVVLRRRFLLAGFVAGVALLAPEAVLAQADYPNKPIRLIVPFAPGGSTDVLARVVAQEMSKDLGQSVVVENRAGANGNIGLEAAARSAPDGYTLAIGATSTLAINPALNPNLPFDPEKDFAPVALLTTVANVLVVPTASSAKELDGLVAAIAMNPAGFNYASPGVGHISHLMGELFKTTAGIDMTHIPYKGDNPAIQDLVAGRVQLMFTTLTAALPQINAGKLHPLALVGAERSPKLPKVPTFGELGYKGFDSASWFGIVAPAKVSPAIVKRLSKATSEALSTTEALGQIERLGMTVSYGNGDDFAEFLRREIAKWHQVVKQSGIKLE